MDPSTEKELRLAVGRDELHIDLEKGSWKALFERSRGKGEVGSPSDIRVRIESGTLCEIAGSGGGLLEWPLNGVSWHRKQVGDVDEVVDIKGVGHCRAATVVGTIPTLLTSPDYINKQRIEVTFALHPGIVLWKVSLFGFDTPCTLDYIKVLDGHWETLIGAEKAKSTSTSFVHINGWQSWSYTGTLECGNNVKQPDIALPNFLNAGFHNRHRGPSARRQRSAFPNKGSSVFESDMYLAIGTACYQELGRSPWKQRANTTIVSGFLSQRRQFGTIRVDSITGGREKITMSCECDDVLLLPGRSMETDWACVMVEAFDDDFRFCNWNKYLSLVGAHCDAITDGGKKLSWIDSNPLTWCSWYCFGPNISEPLLRKQLGVAAEKRFSLFLIDDGWSPRWGDWVFKGEKAGGEDLVAAIRASGMTAGLWMAPFAADLDSKLIQDRGDFVLKDSRSPGAKISNSAYPAKYFAGLDATHPDVLHHVKSTIARHSTSFPYLKLDFLYAAVLRDFRGRYSTNNRFDPTKTRAEAMEMAMKAMRDGAGEGTFLLGCGCPLGSAIGYMDGMRLGADVGPSWAPRFPLPYWDRTNLPCMRNSVRDVLCRSPMNGTWWIGDPDCILLSGAHLSPEEVVALASVAAAVGGLVTVSDDLTSPRFLERFEIAQRVFPTLNRPFDALDIMVSEIPEVFRAVVEERDDGETAVLLCCFNWSDSRGKQFKLNWSELFPTVPQHVHCVEHWTSNLRQSTSTSTGAFETEKIGYHSARIYRLTGSDNLNGCYYLGSDVNFAGKELGSWTATADSIRFHIQTFRAERKESRVWLAIPSHMVARCEGSTVVRASRTAHQSSYYEIVVNGSGAITIKLDPDC